MVGGGLCPSVCWLASDFAHDGWAGGLEFCPQRTLSFVQILRNRMRC
jgi:hypothetical protein